MLIGRDHKAAMAQIFVLLAEGEALARDCARAQAEIATSAPMKRFLSAQTSQEAMHARLFQVAGASLAPRHTRPSPGSAAIARLRAYIEAALNRGELGQSVLAQQVILEGLGEHLLVSIDHGMARYRYGFGPLRRMILRQEHSHHRFGVYYLQRLINANEVSTRELTEQGEHLIVICERMLGEAGALFQFFDEDPALYGAQLRASLTHLAADLEAG